MKDVNVTRSSKQGLNMDVFQAGYQRLQLLYEEGHRIVVSFSAGKDSGICLELAIMAAEATGNLPVDVVMRDEEIMLPGTFEYAERTAERPEVNFHWFIANQPIANVFNRIDPYYWVFDPLLQPEDWVRQPPPYAKQLEHYNIEKLVTPDRFPPAEGKELVVVIGLRANESMNRAMAIHSCKGYLTRMTPAGYRKVFPIYDWGYGDVWLAVNKFGWDYNHAYDTMVKYNIPVTKQRIAPPFIIPAGINLLQMASKAFPNWFVKVCKRIPGAKSAAQFGLRAVTPFRRTDESWSECYQRVNIDEAPAEWLKERALYVQKKAVEVHSGHSTTEFPEKGRCKQCRMMGSWERLAKRMYCGDPFSLSGIPGLNYLEPEVMRKGTGTWGGKATW